VSGPNGSTSWSVPNPPTVTSIFCSAANMTLRRNRHTREDSTISWTWRERDFHPRRAGHRDPNSELILDIKATCPPATVSRFSNHTRAKMLDRARRNSPPAGRPSLSHQVRAATWKANTVSSAYGCEAHL